jgi:hypothetical protein
MPIYGSRDYLLPDYAGEVIKIDGVCYIFDGYESSLGEADVLAESVQSYGTCEDCSASSISSDVLSSAVVPADVSSSQSSISTISSSIYECLDWMRLDNCFVATEAYTYEGTWTGGEGGYWYQLKDAVELLNEAPQTITFTWTLQKYSTESEILDGHDARLSELKEDPKADISAPLSTTGNPVTKAEFMAEVQEAFDQWKSAFEFAYSEAFGFAYPLTVDFVYAGDENSDPSLTRGDFRFAMEAMSFLTLAHASMPLRYAKIGDGKNSPPIHFNKNKPWSKDAIEKHAGDVASFSIALVAAHEIGHTLGFRHNDSFKGHPLSVYNTYRSVLFPQGPNRASPYGAGKLGEMWDSKGLRNSFEDVRGIHEVYGLPSRPIYSCAWACMDDLQFEGASSSVSDFVEGDVLKVDGTCYTFIDTHTGPEESIPACSSGTQKILESPVLEAVFSECLECASGLPADDLDPLLSAKEDGLQAIIDEQPIEGSSSDSSTLDLSQRVSMINDDAAAPAMSFAIHCVDEEVWCIPSYYIDQIFPGETFEIHFNESSSACFTMLEETSSDVSCDVEFDFTTPPINVLGPYFDCLDCVGAPSAVPVLDSSSSSNLSSL